MAMVLFFVMRCILATLACAVRCDCRNALWCFDEKHSLICGRFLGQFDANSLFKSINLLEWHMSRGLQMSTVLCFWTGLENGLRVLFSDW